MNIKQEYGDSILADFGKIEEGDKKAHASVEEETGSTGSFDDGEPQVSGAKSSKLKKIFIFLFIIAAIGVAAFFVLPLLSSDEEEADAPIQSLSAPPPPPVPDFIDGGELENNAFKNNAEAQKNKVNVFYFDINTCLEKHSEAQCVDLYDKSLLVAE